MRHSLMPFLSALAALGLLSYATSASAQEAGGDDHEQVVHQFAVGYFGVSNLPLGAGGGAGAGAPALTDGSIAAPVIGARYWFMPRLGIDAGVGFDATSNGWGVAIHGGLPIALATAKHMTFELTPEATVGFAGNSSNNVTYSGFLSTSERGSEGRSSSASSACRSSRSRQASASTCSTSPGAGPPRAGRGAPAARSSRPAWGPTHGASSPTTSRRYTTSDMRGSVLATYLALAVASGMWKRNSNHDRRAGQARSDADRHRQPAVRERDPPSTYENPPSSTDTPPASTDPTGGSSACAPCSGTYTCTAAELGLSTSITIKLERSNGVCNVVVVGEDAAVSAVPLCGTSQLDAGATRVTFSVAGNGDLTACPVGLELSGLRDLHTREQRHRHEARLRRGLGLRVGRVRHGQRSDVLRVVTRGAC